MQDTLAKSNSLAKARFGPVFAKLGSFEKPFVRSPMPLSFILFVVELKSWFKTHKENVSGPSRFAWLGIDPK
jgi:hypothetical protein